MIVLKDVSLRRGTKLVLEKTGFTLQPGEKASLVGRNGAGKSSLFSLLTNRLQSDHGDVSIPPRWVVAEVVQSMPETDQGATDFVLEGDAPLMAAQAALVAAEESEDGIAIGEAHEALAHAGGFDARARAQTLLMGLGFKIDQVDAPVNSFSGGWRMRLQLARALMCPADLLLLDEPTNHLDLDALVWLEAWLQRYEGTLLMISHDREFLDAITKVTLHLDSSQITRYGSNYSGFETMRAERMEQQQAAFGKQQDKIAHLQKFIARFKAKASKAKQAQSRVKALERMEKLAPVMMDADFEIEFREPESLPNPTLVMNDLAVGYRLPTIDDDGRPVAGGGGDTIIVSGINRSVLPGQRIGILGANGQGKSTLVKTLAQAQPALGGGVTEGKGLRIGYFAQQELDVLRLDEGPLEHMVRLARDVSPNAREQELRDFLGRFRFTGDMARQAVGTLSGGEKARLVLAMLVWQRPNLLLLDEPTNHLDLNTREALSMALNEYEGTVMLVSHDRALLRETCDEFWLVANGVVAPWDGDLDDYQRWLMEQSRDAARRARDAGKEARGGSKSATPPPSPAPAPVVAAPVPTPTAAKAPATVDDSSSAKGRDQRKASAAVRAQLASKTRPLRVELQAAEQRMDKLGKERSSLEGQLASGTMNGADIAEAGRQLNHIAAEVALLEERWLQLTGEIDAIESAG